MSVKFQNPAMLNGLDPVGVTQNPRGQTILHGGAGAPGVFHQVSRCCFELGSVQLLSLTLPLLLPLTLMTRVLPLTFMTA